jgi:hypothetical protein
MRQLAEFLSVLACALFTGASVYISFVEHPARIHLPPKECESKSGSHTQVVLGFASICNPVAKEETGALRETRTC